MPSKDEEKGHESNSAYKSLKHMSRKLKQHGKVTTESDSTKSHEEHFDFAHALHPHGRKSHERRRSSMERSVRPQSSFLSTVSGEGAPSVKSDSGHHSLFRSKFDPLRKLAHSGASELTSAAKNAGGAATGVASSAANHVGGAVGGAVGGVGMVVNSSTAHITGSNRTPVNGSTGPRIADTLTTMSDNAEQRNRVQLIEQTIREMNSKNMVKEGVSVEENGEDTVKQNPAQENGSQKEFHVEGGKEESITPYLSTTESIQAEKTNDSLDSSQPSAIGAGPLNQVEVNNLDREMTNVTELNEESLEIPSGSVPGLVYGDDEPLLPGEKPKDQAKAEARSATRTDSQDDKEAKEEAMLGRGEMKPDHAERQGDYVKTEVEEKKKAEKGEDKKKAVPTVPDGTSLPSEAQQKRFKPTNLLVSEHRALQADYIGWRQVGGWDPRGYQATQKESDDIFLRSTLLEGYISDKFVGDWYQNAALIFITAALAWILGRFKFSFVWVGLVLLFTGTAYRTSVRRMRRNYRDDIIRQTLIERAAESNTETMEWLNSFLVKFWLIYEPSLSQMITTMGNEVLAGQTPGFIDSMMIQKFTLGTKAPRIDSIRSFPHTKPNIVIIDMAFSFTPNDTFDLTARQLQTKINPKAQLGIRVGKGFLTKNFPILLEDVNFKGQFRLKFKLMNRFPHFETLDLSFLEAPSFDFVLKPIGGDKFGFDINIIPGLSKFIKDTINANLGPMLYAPNAFQVNIAQLMQNVGVMSGIGVLSIKVVSCEELIKSSDGRVDPYVVVKDKSLKVLRHTLIKSNTDHPVWNENLSVIVYNTNDNFLLEVLDFNDDLTDRSIGQVTLAPEHLQGSKLRRVPIMSGGRKSGFISFAAHFSPVHMPGADDQSNGRSPRDTKSGILNVKITRARGLDSRINKTAKLSSFAEMEFNGQLIDSTKVTKNSNDPDWNYSGEHIVDDKLSTLFVLRIKDNRATGNSPTVGIFKMRLGQLLTEGEKGNKWFPLEDKRGEVLIETQWKPCNIRVSGSTGNYVEPIGVVRLKVLSATNLRNLEHLGKIDPYTRIMVGKRLVTRTNWFHNELNPVWNETQYIPIENELQQLVVEVMDVEKRAKDRSLGSFKIDLNKLIEQDSKGNYKITLSDKTFSNKLMLPNRGPKGTLQYTIEFYPAIPIISPQVRSSIAQDMKFIEMLRKKIKDNNGDAEKALTETERTALIAKEERLSLSGVDMPLEDQVKYTAGVFACAIVSLSNHKPGQSVRMIANNSSFPFYTSPIIKSSEPYSSNECGDFVSAQINLSSVRIEIGAFSTKEDAVYDNVATDFKAEKEFVEHDKYAGEITIPCKELITDANLQPKEYSVANGAKLSLQVRFFPLPGLLAEPVEDISQNGVIEINLLRADGVRSADSNGFSDPYTAFYLNNEAGKVFKSKTIKETLNPVWNESFRFSVKDYKNSFVKAMVMDWDMGNKDDFLGGYRFDFSELTPLEWKDYSVNLENIKKTKDNNRIHDVPGTLHLRIRFSPGHLQKNGDDYLIGADSVARAAGGLVNIASTGAGHALGAGLNVADAGVGALGSLTKPFKKFKGSGMSPEEAAEFEAASSNFQIQISSITQFTGKAEVQIRCFLIMDGEQEVWRSSNITITDESTSINEIFEMNALPEGQLGVKLIGIKSFGRHVDLGQSSTDLNPGTKQVGLQNGCMVNLEVNVM